MLTVRTPDEVPALAEAGSAGGFWAGGFSVGRSSVGGVFVGRESDDRGPSGCTATPTPGVRPWCTSGWRDRRNGDPPSSFAITCGPLPAARDGYAAAKTQWAQPTIRTVSRYGEAKEPWFDAEARAADDWAESTGWQPPMGA